MSQSKVNRDAPQGNDHVEGRQETQRMVNLRLLVGTLVAIAVLSVAAYAWRSHQVTRTSWTFLDDAARIEADATALEEAAREMEEQGDWEKAREKRGEAVKKYTEAVRRIGKYVEINPEDDEAVVRFAEACGALACRNPSVVETAITCYYDAIGKAGNSRRQDVTAKIPELRRGLARLLLPQGRYRPSQFVATANQVKQLDGNDKEGWRLLALASFGQRVDWESRKAQGGEAESAAKVRAEDSWGKGSIGERCERPDCKDFVGPTIDRIFEEALRLHYESKKAGPKAGDPADWNDDLDSKIAGLSERLARVYRGKPNDAGRAHLEILSQPRRDLSNEEREALADQVMDRMVEDAESSPRPLLARYQYRMEYGLPLAKEDLVEALAAAPSNHQLLLTASRHYFSKAGQRRQSTGSLADARGDYDLAASYGQQVVEEVASWDPTPHVILGSIHYIQGRIDRAIVEWQSGLAKSDRLHHSDDHQLVIELRTRLTDALIAQKRLPEAKEHLEALTRASERLGRLQLTTAGQALLLRMKRSNALMEARRLALAGEFDAVVKLLEPISHTRLATGLEAAQGAEICRMLGHCHMVLADAHVASGELGPARRQWEKAAAAFEQARDLAVDDATVCLAAAAAWKRLGNLDRAVESYKVALGIQRTGASWLELAAIHLQQQREAAPENRNWSNFDMAMREARKADNAGEFIVASWRLPLIEAESRVQRASDSARRTEETAKAIMLIEKTERHHARDLGLFARLVETYERLESPENADRVKQYGQVLELLSDIKKEPALETRLEQASRRLETLHGKYPDNLMLVCQLIELAREAGHADLVQRHVATLEELEGPEGVYWRYYRAHRLLAMAQGAATAELTQVDELIAAIESRRPSWPRGHLLAGDTHLRRKNIPDAIKAYQAAIKLGERRASVYQQLVVLLFQTQRFTEANQYLAILQTHASPSQALTRLGGMVATGQGELEQALRLSAAEAQRKPNDPAARILHAQMLWANGEQKRAKEELLDALKSNPTDSRILSAMFSFHARAGQLDQARQALADLAACGQFDDLEQAIMLSNGHELLGDIQQAEAGYRKAAELAPDDLTVQLRVAQFLHRHKPGKAEEVYRRAIELDPKSSAARRGLAGLLAARGGEKDAQEASELLEQAGDDPNASAEDRRLHAGLLVKRGGQANRDKARKILQGLVADPLSPADNDRLLLAHIFETQGDLPAAREQLKALVDTAAPKPIYLARYVDLLLRMDASKEAAPWLDRLQEAAPNDLTVAVLRARWLDARGEAAQIRPMMEEVTERLLQRVQGKRQQKAQLELNVGNAYASLDLFEQADQWYRRLTDLDSRQYAPVALAMARQQRHAKAIQLCLDAAETDPSVTPILVVTRVLLLGEPAAEDYALAEPLLTDAAETHQDRADLLLRLANIRCAQQQIDDAMELYRRCVELEPAHLVALNNLATLLGERSDGYEEALAYIDSAIDLAGPQAWLLDTKGTILMHRGNMAEAIPLLEDAASSPTADPRFSFHLAIAYSQTEGQLDKARHAMQEARDRHLEEKVLTDKDRQWLVSIEQTLDQ